MVNVTDFIAKFNLALKTKQRMFVVGRSRLNVNFVYFLKSSGSVSGFHISTKYIFIYPNYSALDCSGIKAVTVPSKSVFFGPHLIRSNLRAGTNYILYVDGLFKTSYQCVLLNQGGLVVAHIF